MCVMPQYNFNNLVFTEYVWILANADFASWAQHLFSSFISDTVGGNRKQLAKVHLCVFTFSYLDMHTDRKREKQLLDLSGTSVSPRRPSSQIPALCGCSLGLISSAFSSRLYLLFSPRYSLIYSIISFKKDACLFSWCKTVANSKVQPILITFYLVQSEHVSIMEAPTCHSGSTPDVKQC